jgi:hypothetical protein
MEPTDERPHAYTEYAEQRLMVCPSQINTGRADVAASGFAVERTRA